MKPGIATMQTLPSVNFNKKLKRITYSGSPITDTLTNGFFSVDRNWTVQNWNKAAEQLLGVPAKEILKQNIWEKFTDVIPVEFHTICHSAFSQEKPVRQVEYWGQLGSWFDVITFNCGDTLSVSFKSSNKPHIEYPENPYHRLKLVTELYKFVTEITNDSLWEWNLREKEIFWIDGGHKQVFGYPIENALVPEQFWENCIHPDDRKRVLTGLKAAIADKDSDTWQEEYRFRKADGEYAYVCDRGHIVYENNKATRIIGATQDITEKVLLENQFSLQRADYLRQTTNAVFTAQENERADIGRELHDNINQVLAIAKMYIEIAKTSEEKRIFYLDQSTAMISKVIQEIRQLTKKIIIPGIEFTSLFQNIRNLITDFSEVHPAIIAFYTQHITEVEIGKKLQLNIYRIIQEQLNNIITHAKATHTDIALYKDGPNIVLLISDNGEGCDVEAVTKGVGSINIMSRAQLYHGTVHTISTPGEGYLLKILFPIASNMDIVASPPAAL